MDREELGSGLAFPHATGSVLYYGKETRFKNCPKVVKTVFMQPQFIITAIKYVIRERNHEDVNDELQEMDKYIRNQEDLDDLFKKGELTQRLLTELWTLGKFKRQEHDLLLEVMRASSCCACCTHQAMPGVRSV
jgi:hypothetical protein